MDGLTAIFTCSLYLDDGLVRAIVDAGSQGNPYAVHDASRDPAEMQPVPTTLRDALAQLGEVTSRKGRPALGLMQIAPAWLASFGRAPQEAFEPCTNVTIGTAMLSEFAYECASAARPRTARRFAVLPVRPCVLQRYAEATGSNDLPLIVSLALETPEPAPSRAAQESPIFPTTCTARWGSDCIFLRVGGEP